MSRRSSPRRRRYLNRGTTPLLWATPPSTMIQRIYDESRAAVRWSGGERGAGGASTQRWLRRVSVVFHQRLAAAGIYVEEA